MVFLKFLSVSICQVLFIKSVCAVTPLVSSLPAFEKYVEQAMAVWGVPGVAIAVVEKGHVVMEKGFGVRELGKPDLVDEHTVFRLGSISKGFAGNLTGLLVEEGILGWDDKVMRYLPTLEWLDPKHGQQITLTHLLSHTSGLPRHACTHLLDENQPYAQIVAHLKTVAPVCKVGDCYGYQNVTYNLITDVITTATGRSYEQELRERIFKPLGMTNASTTLAAFEENSNRALPHSGIKDQEVGRARPLFSRPHYYSVTAAGGVNASLHDMVQWLQAQMGYRTDVMPLSVLEKIQTPLINTEDQKTIRFGIWCPHRILDAHYGLGWRILNYAGEQLIAHGGMLKGYCSEIAFLPHHQVGIVILTNRTSCLASILMARFFDMYLDLGPVDWSEKSLVAYQAKYAKELKQHPKKSGKKKRKAKHA